MSSSKPKLPQLKTPMSSTFPSELSALSNSARSPFPGYADFMIKQEDSIKTPITPPLAYTDFLKTMNSPIAAEKTCSRPTPTSAPSSDSLASSEGSDCSCNCDAHKSPASSVPPTPFIYPTSAPSSAMLGHLRIPASPASPYADSPLSARSPFSARSAPTKTDTAERSSGQGSRHSNRYIYPSHEPRSQRQEKESRTPCGVDDLDQDFTPPSDDLIVYLSHLISIYSSLEITSASLLITTHHISFVITLSFSTSILFTNLWLHFLITTIMASSFACLVWSSGAHIVHGSAFGISQGCHL
ncbi:hypothetical protein EYC80_006167 [Monilinia laxa]|uniref:Uncharacterized protein n=1 Tax=Monilinia laxa TaxID=61186 RepID=A0A5N6KGC4_MONLA|nr:hypothetical protein EYC80_006167 [Monilinia laxa]